jgi:hypothetical protein
MCESELKWKLLLWFSLGKCKEKAKDSKISMNSSIIWAFQFTTAHITTTKNHPTSSLYIHKRIVATTCNLSLKDHQEGMMDGK